MNEHEARFLRYSRGKTPIRPSRTLYGYRVICSCGWETRVNGQRREAEQRFRAHKQEAK